MQADKQTDVDYGLSDRRCRGCDVCNHVGPEAPATWLQTAQPRHPAPKMATEEVLRLLRAGADGRSIRERLRIPPSRLRRILNSPTLQRAVEQDRQVARLEKILGSRGGGSGVLKALLSGNPEGVTPAHSGTQRDSAG